MNKFLIVGLGNIGEEYAHTRHNIGFDIVDHLAGKYKEKFQSDRLADVATIRVKNKQLICIKPTTYMNLSGKSVKYWLDKEKIPLEQMLVLVDELALPLDKMRLRGSGSDGGHNGLRSIQEHLGSINYPRLRFGIGNNYPKGMQAEFVLSAWRKEEWPLVLYKIGKSVELVEQFALAGLNFAMNQYNNVTYQL
ncbi:aminoacyl-tRNA hydrolase [Flavihumibacter petaseus]|uniref:Peptidyl-tRNA hydrolase n=1 Tax=Flavihumibacter petaseus NBRC 106054 TaxID=1220578 RepID=A0A0E9N899_9BACT|nr:aminoacyl-tRNA hydrolase [Flavihumibacter petaseus]GAO45610.1 peptidyl-tRNA hydrolase [Flavihumibacter petaseus NBRC 106054]